MSFTPSHEVQMFQPFKLFPHLFLSGCTGSLLLRGLLSRNGAWGCSLAAVCRLPLQRFLASQNIGSTGYLSCGAWARSFAVPGPQSTAPVVWHPASVTPQHVGSSQVRDQTSISCIVRQILCH